MAVLARKAIGHQVAEQSERAIAPEGSACGIRMQCRDVEESGGHDRGRGGIERTLWIGIVEIVRRHAHRAEAFEKAFGERFGEFEIGARPGYTSGRGIAIDGPGLAARPEGLIAMTLEGITALALTAHRIVFDGVIGGMVGADEILRHLGVSDAGKAEARIACDIGRPIEQRNVRHRIDRRGRASARIGQRPPRSEIGAAFGHDETPPQLVRGFERHVAMKVEAGHTKERDRARQEDEADIVRVTVVRALRDEAHPLLRKDKIPLLAGPQMRGEQEADPKAAEPVAVAPALRPVSGRKRSGHGAPRAGRFRHVGKFDPDPRLVLDDLAGEQVERRLQPADPRILCLHLVRPSALS